MTQRRARAVTVVSVGEYASLLAAHNAATPANLCTYQLLPSAETFLADLIPGISQASSRIDLQFHTFEADAVGLPVAHALMEARGSGIPVRFGIDDYINLSHNDEYLLLARLQPWRYRETLEEWRATLHLIDFMRREGIEVRMVNPLGRMKYRALRRNHKKIVVIDGDAPELAVAYAGGINLSEHNASWNDFMVKMTGDVVLVLKDDIDRTWAEYNPGRIVPYSDGLVVTDSYRRSLILPLVQFFIGRAQRRVIIESAYLWGSGMQGVLSESAREQRADVSVIAPLHNNRRVLAPTEADFDRMGAAGVHVFRFRENGGMTHAKGLLADDWGLYGSNIFNGFLAGRTSEVGIATNHPSLVSQLETFLLQDMRRSIRQS